TLTSGGESCTFTFGPYDFDEDHAGPSLPAVLKYQDFSCLGLGHDTFEIAEIPTYNYFWELPLGTQIVEQNGGFLVADFSEARSGNVCVFVTNTCGASQKYCQFLNIREVPEFELSASSSIVCEDSLVDISVVGSALSNYN